MLMKIDVLSPTKTKKIKASNALLETLRGLIHLKNTGEVLWVC
jgi:hypothetical protein